MADNLFPEGYGTEIIEDQDRSGRSVVGYQNGIAFDDGTGDFKRDGRNTILDATGVESWKNWCVNCIQTERYKHPIPRISASTWMRRSMQRAVRPLRAS